MDYKHVPVLLDEVLRFLDPKPGENFIDATLGGGGYTRAIIDKIKPAGKVLAIDLDKDAIEHYKSEIQNPCLAGRQAKFETNLKSQILNSKIAILVHGNFAQIDKIAAHHQFANINGIVADLGLSSYELENRGISFQKKELLDMQFDQNSNLIDAKFILNNWDQKQLEKIFKEFGEEKYSRQIARKILENREKRIEIKYTIDLYQIITDALPKPLKHRADDHARRIFQALRIAVNHELENLEAFLPKAFAILNHGGRLVVVSFHSLEDRMVKRYFAALGKGCVCPPEFPQCICGKSPRGKILTKKPIMASAEEILQNSRSRPAKLRAIEKI